MPSSFSYQITIDKSPSYFRNKEAPERVFKFNPNMKLILILRDPVLRIISHFAHLKAQEKKFFGKKNVTIEEEIFDKNGNIYIKSSKKNNPSFLDITEDFRNSLVSDSLYIDHLNRWLKYFNISQFIFVNGHEFIKNPYNEVKKVEKFLGLSPFFKRDHYVFGAKKGFYCLNGELLNKTRNECLNSKKGRPHPDIDPKTIDKIKTYIKPYSVKFFKFLKIEPFWEF
jgi:[heparan sulfate]-glucosamine 3-sulfotransferase 1